MAKKKNSASNIAVWVILVLLIVGLAGFGTTSFTSSRNAVAEVGDREISIREYANALQAEINRLSQQFGTQLSFAQAQMFGVDRAVLGRLLTTAALENEADELGLSAGDDRVRDALLAVPAFQGVDGSFDREGYRFVLEQSGLSEGEFEETLRADLSRQILEEAVSGAAAMPQAWIDTVLLYQGETRDLTYAVLTPEDLEAPVPEPTEEELRAWWEENSEAYMLPETRAITYAWLTPEMIAGSIEGDDAALQRLYEARRDEYDRPERRLVERLVYTSREAAQEAMTALETGARSFEELVAERDLTLADVDLGDVTRAQLGAGGEAVFALEGPGLAGPVETDLGHAIYRMNGILAAQKIPFEEAREDLLVEYRTDAARRRIEARIDEIDDLLAGGATLEELGAETELQLGEIAWTEDTTDGIAAFPEFRQAAQGAEPGDFPEVILAEDGSLFALRIDEVIAPRVEPFEDARDRVAADWTRQKTVEALAAQGRALAEEMRTAGVEAPIPQEDAVPAADAEEPEAGDPAGGGAVDGDAAEVVEVDDAPEGAEDEAGAEAPETDPEMIVETGLRRDGFLPDTPRGFVEAVFGMEDGEVRVIEGATAAYVVRLDAIAPPDLSSPEVAAAADSLRAQLSQAMGEDILGAYAAEIQESAGISLNQATLNAVHAQYAQ